MNLPTLQPERAWQMVLDQLRAEMSVASFNTWVKDTEFVSFNNGLFTIGTANAYGCEWLTSRLTSTVSRLLEKNISWKEFLRFSLSKSPQ
jgi:chromosomal replication initiation ATPase DnaA